MSDDPRDSWPRPFDKIADRFPPMTGEQLQSLAEEVLRVVQEQAFRAIESQYYGPDDPFVRQFNALVEAKRTRIQPGADPRREWSPRSRDALGRYRLDDRGRRALRPESKQRYYVEVETNVGLVVDTISRPVAMTGPSGWARYVPFDVVRWRDPEHRAELTRRARELAAAARRAGGE